MNEEMNINITNGYISFINNGIAFSQFGVAREILDLITNLQEENEYLKKEKKKISQQHIYTLEKLIETQTKIEKTIEYIKENDYIDLNGYDLLKILGSDE